MSGNNPYQPVEFAGAPTSQQKPKNYLVESILITLCCCLPLGIVGIVFAAQVDSKWNAGDHAGAISAADNAKKFVLIGLVLGLIVNLLVVALQMVAAIGAAQGGGF